MNSQRLNIRRWTIVFAALMLTACQSQQQSLYYYGQYNAAVYSYFKADDVTLSEQIQILEDAIGQASASDKPIAPGVHAHLAMLYFESGAPVLGNAHFESEKHLYPESREYIEFLQKNYKGM